MKTVGILLLCISALCGAASARAQATLTGLVVQDRLKGAPAPRVPVWALGATQTLSGDDGVFVLRFPAGRPGQDVSVRAGEKNWEVVNEEALDTRLPDPGPTSRLHLTIVVAKPADRIQRRAELFGLVARDAVEKSYARQLAELQTKVLLTEQERVRERARLERELEQALALAKDWAKRTSEAKPQDSGGTYGEALRPFTQGKVDQALQLLSDERLEREAKAFREKVEQNVGAWQLKAQLLITQLDFNGAGKAHEQAVRLAPGSFTAWFGYGQFNQGRNSFQDARKGYERAIALARDASQPADLAAGLNNLGNLSGSENRHDESRKLYEEALAIRRELVKTDPTSHLSDLASTLNNLGVLSSNENRNAEARQQYEEAVAIYRKLAEANPATNLPALATALSNLGVLSRDERRLGEARQHLEEALTIRRQLAMANAAAYLPAVATTLNNLGTLSSEQFRWAEARQRLEEALKIYRELAQANPATYLPSLARTLSNLGVLSSDENRNDEARKQYEEALAIRRDLAKAYPAVYLPSVAGTLNNLGVLNRDENRLDEARQQLEEASRIYREFVAKSPGTYAREMANVEHNLRSVKP